VRKRFRDSVVVVTGASSGIGRATALAFAKRGATVVVNARRPQPLDELVAACEQAGGRALAMPADVTDADAVDRVASDTVGQFGRVDVWVNNAAVNQYGRFEEVPLDEWRRVVEINLFGMAHGSRAVLPWMREQGEGVLINVSSVLGKVAAPYQSAYVASKFAIRGLSDAIRQEVADAPGIAVCTVLPGAIDTPLFQRAGNYMGRRVTAPRPTIAADRVADAILTVARHPRREIVVGASTRMGLVNARIAPGLTERAAAAAMATEQFGDEYAAPTPGAVLEPIPLDGDVSGGWQTGRDGRAWKAGAATLVGAAAIGAAVRSRRKP
jgi:short-subunit dehydrogenase